LKLDNLIIKKMKVLKPFEKIEKNILINSKIEEEIISAFKTRKVDKLNEYLSDKGSFFGLSKRVFIAKIQYLFNENENCTCNYIFGTSSEIDTCNKVLEFKYTDQNLQLKDDSFLINSISLEELILGSKLKKNQFRIQFMMQIENCEVIKITKPRKYLNLFEYFKAKKEN